LALNSHLGASFTRRPLSEIDSRSNYQRQLWEAVIGALTNRAPQLTDGVAS
jgi:hypothetical protein